MNKQHTPKPFAKVFERNGHQVLVHHDTDENGEAAIAVMFPFDNLGFHRLEFTLKEGADKHEVFDKFTEDEAFALREHAMGQFAAMIRAEVKA